MSLYRDITRALGALVNTACIPCSRAGIDRPAVSGRGTEQARCEEHETT